ncbi:MAG TPA: thioredoxin TrxC [Methyloprofundus sp.]|uniref:thioredoxin TrxC n=1 Tax=Methyloprofundus sp. TaxID=2020875 RepID=UPI0017EF2A23|nr:thioredoxin TrxC [Methyloprofundus sp.]HIG65628.1 thioredoxin TrxC [Methyloprofundus sp.]HIL78005.1 thioredoxin TrxC [Methylococcales bacterium]
MSNLVHIVCPECSAINRIPADRLSDDPQCGKCHQVVFSAHPVDLTARNFQQHMQRNDIPVLIDFWAPWCGPCKTMAPAFIQAAGQLEPAVRLAKLNTEAEQSIAGRFGIRSIPTLVLFQNGKELARQAGAMSTQAIAIILKAVWVKRQRL